MNQLQEEPKAPAPPELIRRDTETGREGAQGKANPTDDYIPNHQTAEIPQGPFQIFSRSASLNPAVGKLLTTNVTRRANYASD